MKGWTGFGRTLLNTMKVTDFVEKNPNMFVSPKNGWWWYAWKRVRHLGRNVIDFIVYYRRVQGLGFSQVELESVEVRLKLNVLCLCTPVPVVQVATVILDGLLQDSNVVSQSRVETTLFNVGHFHLLQLVGEVPDHAL
jgi:hypothetical protein